MRMISVRVPTLLQKRIKANRLRFSMSHNKSAVILLCYSASETRVPQAIIAGIAPFLILMGLIFTAATM